MNEPTVFIVDNNPDIRLSISETVESIPLPTESFSSANTFLEHYSIYRVGCLLLDVHMPEMDGLQLQRHLNQYKYRLPIIFMTSRGDIRTAVTAMKNGAMDYLEKPLEPKQISDLLKQAVSIDRKRRQMRLEYAAIQARVSNLTPREREVLDLVIHENTNRKIADYLGVSVKTVEFHRSRVMQKMHAHSLLELAEMVKENGAMEAVGGSPH